MLLRLFSPVCFYFSNVATGKYKIAYVVHNIFLLDDTELEFVRYHLLEKAFPNHQG